MKYNLATLFKKFKLIEDIFSELSWIRFDDKLKYFYKYDEMNNLIDKIQNEIVNLSKDIAMIKYDFENNDFEILKSK